MDCLGHSVHSGSHVTLGNPLAAVAAAIERDSRNGWAKPKPWESRGAKRIPVKVVHKALDFSLYPMHVTERIHWLGITWVSMAWKARWTAFENGVKKDEWIGELEMRERRVSVGEEGTGEGLTP